MTRHPEGKMVPLDRNSSSPLTAQCLLIASCLSIIRKLTEFVDDIQAFIQVRLRPIGLLTTARPNGR